MNASKLAQRVHSPGVAGRLLPQVEGCKLQAEGADAPDHIDKHAIGELLVARGNQRLVHGLQWGHQLFNGKQWLYSWCSRHNFPARAHECERPMVCRCAKLVQLCIRPSHSGPQTSNQIRDYCLVWLRCVLCPWERTNCRCALVHAERPTQGIELAQVQEGCLATLHGDHLAGDLRGHIGVAVSIATHPRCKNHRRGIQRQALLALCPQHRVKTAQETRHCIPERCLHHSQALLGFHLRRWLASA
mmetsp:Transcript_118127/g.297041  ORF Transcript_118127/g.297041 Transcript_118127/m.297041 type:complete len:245 (+) Transcript_118127:1531-2265(+)